jgi:hypothetical protein
MSFVHVTGPCVACGRVFTFSPTKVPSIRINGEREPVCRSCFERWKVIHNKPDHPLDSGAYEPDELALWRGWVE